MEAPERIGVSDEVEGDPAAKSNKDVYLTLVRAMHQLLRSRMHSCPSRYAWRRVDVPIVYACLVDV